MRSFRREFLVIGSDRRVAAAIADALSDLGDVLVSDCASQIQQVVDRAREVTAILQHASWFGPDELLGTEALHAAHPVVPVLCMARELGVKPDPAWLELCVLPFSVRTVRGFAQRAIALQRVRETRLAWFEQYATARLRALGAGDSTIAAIAASALSVLAPAGGVLDGTLRGQLHELLAENVASRMKEQAEALLAELLDRLQEQALGGGKLLEEKDNSRPPSSGLG